MPWKRIVVALVVASAATTAGGVLIANTTAVEQAATVDAPARRVVQPAAAAPAPDQHERLVDLVNAARAGEGLAALAWNDLVAAAATAHSLDMAATGSMNHTGSDGSDGGDRLTAQGFRWTAWGENIAAGFTDTEPLFDAWMASSGHRRQILGDYRFVGLGVATSPSGTSYWTLVVASA